MVPAATWEPDPAFTPPAIESATRVPRVDSILRQPDGRVLLAGAFDSVNGSSRPNIVRLNRNGTTDVTFTPPAQSEYITAALSIAGIQPDGGIVVQDGGQLRRLRQDGAMDPAFPAINAQQAVVDASGRIVCRSAEGKFSRYLSSGALDPNFAQTSVSGVTDMQSGPNGTTILQVTTAFEEGALRRLTADGVLDPTYAAPFHYQYEGGGFAVISDGSVFLYTELVGIPTTTRRVQRFDAGGAPIRSFDLAPGDELAAGFFGETVAAGLTGTLKFGGSRPQVMGADSDGFLTSASVLSTPPVQRLRLTQPLSLAPAIQRQPMSVSGGTSAAVMSITVSGATPLTYQWYKGDALVSETKNSWDTTDTRSFTNAQTSDAGLYHVVVSNAQGTVTSLAARVDVKGPVSVLPPPGPINVVAGQLVALTASAPPAGMSYTWKFMGAPLVDRRANTGGTDTLWFSAIKPTDAGSYTCTASNASAPAASATWVVNVVDGPTTPARLANLSVRARAGSGGGVDQRGHGMTFDIQPPCATDSRP